MRNDHYPQGKVQALLLTDLVTPNTRHALQARLHKKPVVKPRYFDADSFMTLQAVCMRLMPQPDPERLIDLPGCLDDILAEGKGNGWRYDAMPDDREAFTRGLKGINENAVSEYGLNFHVLPVNQQDLVLTAVQSGEATGTAWKAMPAALFFEELLAAIAEIYYSHPFAKEEIGEVAFADAKGWQKTGLNEVETHEPQPLPDK